MRLMRRAALGVCGVGLVMGCAWSGMAAGHRDVLYQVSTLDGLLAGVYGGTVSFETLGRHGDFGLGTCDHLDGEMVMLEGQAYQITTDGAVHLVPPEVTTPFAMVTWLDADITFEVPGPITYERLQAKITEELPTDNVFYAIAIAGDFETVRVRSVPAQTEPYPPLEEVVADQAVFDLSQMSGTMAGFRCPGYVGGINLAGYHLHFLSDDCRHGGHALSCRGRNLTVTLDTTCGLNLVLPDRGPFFTVDLTLDRTDTASKVER